MGTPLVPHWFRGLALAVHGCAPLALLIVSLAEPLSGYPLMADAPEVKSLIAPKP